MQIFYGVLNVNSTYEVVGISTKVLTQRLRMLLEIGIIYCQYEPTIPR